MLDLDREKSDVQKKPPVMWVTLYHKSAEKDFLLPHQGRHPWPLYPRLPLRWSGADDDDDVAEFRHEMRSRIWIQLRPASGLVHKINCKYIESLNTSMANQRFESAIAYINSSANTLFIGDNKNMPTVERVCLCVCDTGWLLGHAVRSLSLLLLFAFPGFGT